MIRIKVYESDTDIYIYVYTGNPWLTSNLTSEQINIQTTLLTIFQIYERKLYV